MAQLSAHPGPHGHTPYPSNQVLHTQSPYPWTTGTARPDPAHMQEATWKSALYCSYCQTGVHAWIKFYPVPFEPDLTWLRTEPDSSLNQTRSKPLWCRPAVPNLWIWSLFADSLNPLIPRSLCEIWWGWPFVLILRIRMIWSEQLTPSRWCPNWLWFFIA